MGRRTLAGLTGWALAVALLPAGAEAQARAPSFDNHRLLPQARRGLVTDAHGRGAMTKGVEVPASPLEDALARASLARADRAKSKNRRACPSSPIASSFTELLSRAVTPDSVWITTYAGTTIQAKILALSPSSVTLRVNGDLVRLSEDEVSAIEHGCADSIWNGLKHGAAIGLLSGVLVGSTMCQAECGADSVAVVLGGGTALGAGIGAAVAAAMQPRVTIYRNRSHVVNPSNAARAQIDP